MPLEKLDSFSFNHSDQVDKLYEGKTSAQIKALLDSRGVDLQTKLNNIVNVLKSITDVDSGADNIGVTTIPGISGNTVQSVLESLKTYINEQLQNITLGSIPNDSITESQMIASMKKIAGGVAKYDDLGNISNLTTEYKLNAVGAVNEIKNKIDTHLADTLYQTAGGTATTIILNGIILENGHSKTFIANANNNGNATTINGKHLYKPNTTIAPTLIYGKAYTVWYSSASNCFFIKASATGTATPAQVLANVPYSNENDNDLIGTMPINGAINVTQTTSGQVTTIPMGYTSGGQVTNNITIESLGGKRKANGNGIYNYYITGSSADNTTYQADINIQLPFTPSTIIVYSIFSVSYPQYYRCDMISPIMGVVAFNLGLYSGSSDESLGSAIQINGNSFSLSQYFSSSDNKVRVNEYSWIAYS